MPSSGTVYTPGALANSMVRSILGTATDRWLEPCVGNGALLQALASHGVTPDRIRGIDLEPNTELTDALADTLRGQEFLAWALETTERFQRIVANPPYVALEKTPTVVRQAAMRVAAPDGTTVPGDANSWYAFLCASIRLLVDGGCLCFVLPSAWEYANYAAPLRERIHEYFARVEVHRSVEPLFRELDVHDGSVVLTASGYYRPQVNGTPPRRRHAMSRTEHPNAASLIRTVGADQHAPIALSRAVGQLAIRDHATTYIGESALLLGDVVSVRLGGVTGDSNYFLLSESKRISLNLPSDSVHKVVSRSRHLTVGAMVPDVWKQLRRQDERVWLFRPMGDVLKNPHVQAYIDRPVDLGGCDRSRFKIKVRGDSWYVTPLPTRIHGFMSGMATLGPWICLNGMRSLAATNTLYVISFHDAMSRDERAAWSLTLFSSAASRELRPRARWYADGLRKYEPGDLMAVRIPRVRRVEGAYRAYVRAATAFLSGRVDAARAIADRWI